MLTSTDDERRAAEEAKAVLRSLVPSSPRSEAKLSIMRNAADVAMNAIQKFSGEKDLNVARFGSDGARRALRLDGKEVPRARGDRPRSTGR
jgi:hypothetical protein